MREFRAAWIASVANIDWPSRPGLPAEEQQRELIALLDRAAALKLNAVLLQVRPACDALYPSAIEPWSEYLTGKMGQPPQPFYDPLAFAVTHAHARGLELHAWFNPFRARHPGGKSPVSPNHITRTHPHLVRKYNSYLWLDPAEPAVKERSIAVILDVVKRYDIDGVHLDDYFYPYKSKDASGKLVDFPDAAGWNNYRAGGGQLDRADWRRHQIDQFVQSLYHQVKQTKPWVKVGISPFGIWRPGHPPQIRGMDAFNDIYADSRKWLAHGWVDYFAPQLYWDIDPPEQSFPVLLRWWTDQNTRKRHLWPGISAARANRPASEIANQIRLTRTQPGATGYHIWSISSLAKNRDGISDLLARELHVQPALVPASPWLGSRPPSQPKTSIQPGSSPSATRLSWEPAASDSTWLWVLQARASNRWYTAILPGNIRSRTLSDLRLPVLPDAIAITAVDRVGNTSSAAVVQFPKHRGPLLSQR